ncbi:helix-turn-helix domain-containing protein [Serinibacter arcticus]|uniref:helix-turn-helix domain-containing protein n=1 Tax=Serinibacter arcticus TaxID=1655435 RepID=UPI0018EEC9B1|nr:DNA-binding protein [Serinibacter arcticus]
MSQLDSATAERNRDAQRELYGEPLGDTFRRMLTTFGLNQTQLASVLGLSAPMLSQLIAGHRVKIGNPAVLERVRGLEELATLDSAETLTPAELAQRLEAVRTVTGHLTRTVGQAPSDPAAIVRHALREVASGRDLRQAALLLQVELPELAEFLLVCGTGSEDEARAHYGRVVRGG